MQNCPKLNAASSLYQVCCLWLKMTLHHSWEAGLTFVWQIIRQQAVYNTLNTGNHFLADDHGEIKNIPHQICAQFFVVFLICLCFLAMRLLENTDLRRNPWFSWFELLSDPEGGGNATKGLFENATTEKEEDAGARDERRVRAAVSCFFSVQHRMFHVRTAFIYLVSSSDVTLHVPDCVIYGS